MKASRFIPAFLLFLFSFSFQSFSQEPSDTTKAKKVVIKTTDGQERSGVILSDDGREVLFKTDAMGNIYIPKSNIVSITDADLVAVEKVNGQVMRVGPFTTRYQFTTNALPIKKGEDYAMLNLFGPEVHFALSDRFTLGIMSTWIASPMVLAAKYSIKTNNENVNFGIGTLLGTSGYIRNFQAFGGLHWAMLTLGKRTQNITFSLGYGYFNDGGSSSYVQQTGVYSAPVDTSQGWPQQGFSVPGSFVNTSLMSAPLFSVAGITPIGKKASLIIDAMFIVGNGNDSRRNVEYFFDDPNYSYIPTSIEVSENSSKTTILVFMPGMRFQQSETRAFQVSLAGVSVFDDFNSFSFPLPSASWFYKF